MKVHPYLAFNGNCQEAFQFYEQHLGGKITMLMTNGESPMAEQTPPERRGKVMHASMTIGGTVLQASDAPPNLYNTPEGINISLMVADADEAERVFAALSEGGTVQYPLEQTFWSVRFGMVTDRFSIPWIVNCEQAA